MAKRFDNRKYQANQRKEARYREACKEARAKVLSELDVIAKRFETIARANIKIAALSKDEIEHIDEAHLSLRNVIGGYYRRRTR